MSNERIVRSFSEDRTNSILVTVAGLAGAVMMGLVAVGMAGNPIKNLMVYAGVILLVISSLKPYLGLHLLIVSSACLDFFKRFIVLFGMGSSSDVMGVLAVAPLILLGTFIGVCVLHPIFTKRMLDQDGRRLALFALFVIALSIAAGFRRKEFVFEILGATANKSAYLLLLPVVFVLYRDKGFEKISKLLRFLIVVYVPVALYGIHQFVFGLSQFDIDYLQSGLTSTSTNLYDLHPRPFSTLNSPHSFCIATGVLFILSLVMCSKSLKTSRGFFSSKGRFLLPILFLVACGLSLGRTGWLVCMLGPLAMFAFQTRARTILFYSISVGLFSLMVWKADVIFASLEDIQALLPTGTDFEEQAFRIGTYSERLFGFQNVFTNRSMWTWFGNTDMNYRAGDTVERDDMVHDALGQTLVTYGFVGLAAFLVVGGLSLFVLHRRILAIQNVQAELIGRGLLSTSFAIVFSGMLSGSHLSVFPLNLLFWVLVATLITISQAGTAWSGKNGDSTPNSAMVPTLPSSRKRRFSSSDSLTNSR